MTAAKRVQRCRQKKREGSAGVPAVSSTVGYGSVFPTKFASVSTLTLELDHADDDGFIALLAELHQRVVDAKDDNFLMSPATFDAAIAGAQTQRGLENVTRARGIWLDFDDGHLVQSDFAAALPTLRFAAFNTYSSTATNNRWRAFIPTSRDMSADEYGIIVRQLERQLVDQRWGDRRSLGRQHGLDASKLHAASLFYAPCQAADENASFFHDHKQSQRAALDVDYWLSAGSNVPPPNFATAPVLAGDADRELIADAVGAWRSTPAGSGHSAFFALATRLSRAGLPMCEIEGMLREEAVYAHSPNERRREIVGVVASLSGGQGSR